MIIDNLLNKSELARRLNISPSLFNNKLDQVHFNKFSDKEILELKQILFDAFENIFEINNSPEWDKLKKIIL